MFWLAALSLGFLGSFHCIGMCGPIALSIPVKRTSTWSVFSGSLIYNLGRVLTYTIIGFLFGLLGSGFAMAGWQSILSVGLGVFILVLLFLPRLSVFKMGTGLLVQTLEKLKAAIRQLFGTHTSSALALIGLLNGLLPCGLVYLGIAGAIATTNPIQGSLFMLFFGLGTLPAMLSITVIRDYISIKFRERIRTLVPVFVGIMAVLLILRGLNLGIPYVSPSIEMNKGVCHHQCCK